MTSRLALRSEGETNTKEEKKKKKESESARECREKKEAQNFLSSFSFSQLSSTRLFLYHLLYHLLKNGACPLSLRGDPRRLLWQGENILSLAEGLTREARVWGARRGGRVEFFIKKCFENLSLRLPVFFCSPSSPIPPLSLSSFSREALNVSSWK